jgi:hypothetical protein
MKADSRDIAHAAAILGALDAHGIETRRGRLRR